MTCEQTVASDGGSGARAEARFARKGAIMILTTERKG